MSFLLPIALLLGLTAIFPIIAHALRRGQARPVAFPATRLVPSKTSSAKERHRLEDRFLLLLRALLLFCLAALAASPFVQCSRLSLSRTNGASLSAALIIDDSGSMRARDDSGKTRFEGALNAARGLLDRAQPGDSFSVVLAGRPARVLTPPTTELASVKDALEGLAVSDRETDLVAALSLARGLQDEVLQKDRPLVLLSDLASDQSDQLDLSGVVLPDLGLREAFENCAILQAIRGTQAVQAEISCTSQKAAEGRSVELVDEKGESLSKPVAAQDGAVQLEWNAKKEPGEGQWKVRLTEAQSDELDRIAEDDSCPVMKTTSGLSIAVRADEAKAGLKTGAGTVIQAGLEALDRGVLVAPIGIMPDQEKELAQHAALIIDDPEGFTPEVRDAIVGWVRSGGVAALLLGPGIDSAPLGSTFEPFLQSPPQWTTTTETGVKSDSSGALGSLTSTWSDLGTKKRALLAEEENGVRLAQWGDGAPLVFERLEGRGQLITVTLPASVDRSDLALRPAFLELLDYIVSQAAMRRGALATPTGSRWTVGKDARVLDPNGLELEKEEPDGEATHQAFVVPAIAGLHTIQDPKGSSSRYAMRHPREHTRQPVEAEAIASSEKQEASLSQVGISREIALIALILAAIELAARVFRPSRASGLPKAA